MLAFFLATILNKRLGYDRVMSQLMQAPPAFAGLFVSCIGGYYSDLWKLRAPFIIGNALVATTGLVVLFVDNLAPQIQYFALVRILVSIFQGLILLSSLWLLEPILICHRPLDIFRTTSIQLVDVMYIRECRFSSEE